MTRALGVLSAVALFACSDEFVTAAGDAGSDGPGNVMGGGDAAAEGGADAAKVDSGADAGADARPLSFCEKEAPAPAFCSDWDEGSTTAAFALGAPAMWTAMSPQNALLSLDNMTHKSGVASLHFETPSIPAMEVASAPLHYAAAMTNGTEIDVSFEMVVQTAATAPTALVLSIGSMGGGLQLDMSTATTHKVGIGGVFYPATLTEGTWGHIDYVMKVVGGTHWIASVSVDGGTAYVFDGTSATSVPLDVTLQGGAVAAPTAWDVDNFVVTVKP